MVRVDSVVARTILGQNLVVHAPEPHAFLGGLNDDMVVLAVALEILGAEGSSERVTLSLLQDVEVPVVIHVFLELITVLDRVLAIAQSEEVVDASNNTLLSLPLVLDVLGDVFVDVEEDNGEGDGENCVEHSLDLWHPLPLLQGELERVLALVAESDLGGEDVVELLQWELFVDLLQIHRLLLCRVRVEDQVIFWDIEDVRETVEFAELFAAALEVLHLVIADTDCFAQISFSL